MDLFLNSGRNSEALFIISFVLTGIFIDTIIDFQFIYFHILNVVIRIPFSSEIEFKE